MTRWATLAICTAAFRNRHVQYTDTASGQAGDGWITLFDGKNLDQWDSDGTATFKIEDGAVIATDKKDPKAVASYLVTKDSVQGLRDPRRVLGQRRRQQRHLHPLQTRRRSAAKTCYEVNIFDKRPDPTYGTGAHRPYRRGQSDAEGRRQVEHLWRSPPRAAKLTVTFERQEDRRRCRQRPVEEGPIALQFGVGTVKFRKVADQAAVGAERRAHCAVIAAGRDARSRCVAADRATLLRLAVDLRQQPRQRRAHHRHVLRQHGEPERHHPESEDRQEADDAAGRQRDADRDAIGLGRRGCAPFASTRHAVRDALLQAIEFFVEVRLVAPSGFLHRAMPDQGTSPALRSSDKKRAAEARPVRSHDKITQALRRLSIRAEFCRPGSPAIDCCHSSVSWLKPRLIDMSKHCSQVGLSGRTTSLLRGACVGAVSAGLSGAARLTERLAPEMPTASRGWPQSKRSACKFPSQRALKQRKSPPAASCHASRFSVNCASRRTALKRLKFARRAGFFFWEYNHHISVSTYPRPLRAALCSDRLAHRGRRLKRRSDDGARCGARQWHRVGAPGGAGLSRRGPARHGTPTPSRLGSRKLGAITPADRKAGEGSLASSLAPPGAPSPRSRGDGKGDTGRPRARNN